MRKNLRGLGLGGGGGGEEAGGEVVVVGGGGGVNGTLSAGMVAGFVADVIIGILALSEVATGPGGKGCEPSTLCDPGRTMGLESAKLRCIANHELAQ